MGFSWHLAENGFAVSGFLSPFCACRSAQTREMHDTATLLSSLHKIQNFPLKKKKKSWEVPNLLLLHVLADFSTRCSLELLSVTDALGISHHSDFLESQSLEAVSKWFLGWIMQEKMWDFWLFALFPALLTRENSSCTKISSLLLSFLSLPSPVPKTWWFYNSEFWLMADVLQPYLWAALTFQLARKGLTSKKCSIIHLQTWESHSGSVFLP